MGPGERGTAPQQEQLPMGRGERGTAPQQEMPPMGPGERGTAPQQEQESKELRLPPPAAESFPLRLSRAKRYAFFSSKWYQIFVMFIFAEHPCCDDRRNRGTSS